jgi:hypothetical protein
MVTELLRNNDIADLSAAGFCAAHYACLGDHLSTLRLVLKVKTRRECVKSQCSVHLSFASHNLLASADIQDVVDLLMAHGASTDDPSDS